LVELLVVISIIALLIAILLPSLRKARSQAKRTVCASQLREVSTAIWNYSTEENSRVPYVISPMTAGTGNDLDGSPMPGFGDPMVVDAEINPFKLRPDDSSDTARLWPESLPNALASQLSLESPVFRCPAAKVGWPRDGGEFQMTYRPAGANQLDGTVPTAAELASQIFNVQRESFRFMDGRPYQPPQPPRQRGTNTQSLILLLQERQAARGTFLRDLIELENDRAKGPHDGGCNVLNKRLEVEFREQDVMDEDLKPNGTLAVFF